MQGRIRSLLRGEPRTRGWFDEPAGAIAGSFATFRGWVASRDPIDSIVLEADGRVETLAVRHERPDVRTALGLPHVAGWEHSLHVASATASPRTFTARLIVNGETVESRAFTCTARPTGGALEADPADSAPWDLFCARARALPASAQVLETGTRRADPAHCSHVHHLFPGVPRENYLMADMQPGIDVDVIADAHALPAAWTNRFDAYVSHSVFEHLARPWLAAHEVARVLAPGGFCHVMTHQAFPLHGHPSDYFRFSTEALRLLFEDAGLDVIEVGYKGRVKILLPPSLLPVHQYDSWNEEWPSYAYVALLAEKRRP